VQDRLFWSQAGLILRPTVSDHVTGQHAMHAKRAILLWHLCPSVGHADIVSKWMDISLC